MIRVRRSLLDEYRRVVDTEYGNEVELIETIRGKEREEKWQMAAGTAWHACVADPVATGKIDFDNPEGTPKPYNAYGEYSFDRGHVMGAHDLLGPGMYEVPGARFWTVRGTCVMVTGTADHLNGLVIQDNKAKFSSISIEDYEVALQWRLYLLIHHGSMFRYNLFEFSDPKGPAGYCKLRHTHSFRFWPYPRMEDDCVEWIERFVAWARGLNLLRYLDPERRAA